MNPEALIPSESDVVRGAFVHARRRAMERLGMDWRGWEYDALCRRIRRADREFFARGTASEFGAVYEGPVGGGRYRWALEWNGVWFRVVYDRRAEVIVTVLEKLERGHVA